MTRDYFLPIVADAGEPGGSRSVCLLPLVACVQSAMHAPVSSTLQHASQLAPSCKPAPDAHPSARTCLNVQRPALAAP